MAWQRCIVHFLRSLLPHVSKRYQPAVISLVRLVFAQPDLDSAREQLRRAVDMLEPRFHRVATLLAEAEPEVLTYMTFPKSHWTKLYSTNVLERLMRTIKARTRVVGVFPDEPSLTRLAGAVLMEEHDEWADARRYIAEESMALLDPDAAGRELLEDSKISGASIPNLVL